MRDHEGIGRVPDPHERVIHRYVKALDTGDMDGVAAVLQAAMDDPELDRLISEVNFAYQDEELLIPASEDAELVRNLLGEHLVSAFDMDEPEDEPLTVGIVAARLEADRRVPQADREANRLLIGNTVELPEWLSRQEVERLANMLGVEAGKRFWRVFRDTAISLQIEHSRSQAQLAAARKEGAKRGKPSRSSRSSDARGEGS